MPCIECGKSDEHEVDATKHFVRERNSQNIFWCNMCLMQKKVIFREKNNKNEHNVVESGLDIIPARNVKMG